jgi:ribosomal protein L37E
MPQDQITNTIYCRGCNQPFYYMHREITENAICPFCGYGHMVTRVQWHEWDGFEHEYRPGHYRYKVQ